MSNPKFERFKPDPFDVFLCENCGGPETHHLNGILCLPAAEYAIITERNARVRKDFNAPEIAHRFVHHPPRNQFVVIAHESVRELLGGVAQALNDRLPEGREKALAMTKLEEALFWANAAIARSPGNTDVNTSNSTVNSPPATVDLGAPITATDLLRDYRSTSDADPVDSPPRGDRTE